MHVYVLRGAPRSGKSTLVRVFRKMFNDVGVVSADDYWTGPAGLYSYDKDFEPEAHRSCFRRFLVELETGREVIVVDNTCSRLLEAAPYILAAESHGYVTKLVTVTCDLGVIQARNEQCKRGIPPEVIEKMVARIAEATPPPWWKHATWDEEAISSKCQAFGIDPDQPDEEVERRPLNG